MVAARPNAQEGIFFATILLILAVAFGSLCDAAVVTQLEVPQTLNIDGNLEEEAWGHSEIIDFFTQVEPVEGAQPSQATTVRFLYDKNFLYVGITCFVSADAPVVARQRLQEKLIDGDDKISLLLDAYRDRTSGYRFTINPNGVRNEALIQNSDEFNEDWSGIWFGETYQSAGQWSAS